MCYITFRYEKAGQDPPVLMYTDTDCCSTGGTAQRAQLFKEWSRLQVCIYFYAARFTNATCAGKARHMALHEKAWPWMHL